MHASMPTLDLKTSNRIIAARVVSVVDSGRALSLLDNMLWTAAIVSAPILFAILVVGLIISIFQVTTQLQEMTLSYVPKMLVTAGLLILLGPWMMAQLTQFASNLYTNIPSLAGQ